MKKENTDSILYVIGSLDRGGAEQHLCRLLPELDRTRFSASVFTISYPGELASFMEESGIRVISPWIQKIRGGKLARAALLGVTAIQFLTHLIVKRPRIVHFFLPHSYLFGGPLALLTGHKRLVMSRRSLNEYQKNHPAFITSMEKFLHRRMAGLLGNSKQVIRQLIEQEDAPTERTRLIYNGLPPTPEATLSERAEIRKSLKIGNDDLVLIIVANLIPYKGHRDLIQGLGAHQEKFGRNWKLLIAGRDCGIRKDLEDLAEELGIRENIQFLGSRTDVPLLLNASDISILCSHQEGFSNTILESMASGLPMVVTDVGGNAEAVINGENGLVVPARSPDKLGEAITTLAGAPELMKEMGGNNKVRIQQHFSNESCIRSYEALYSELLAK